MEFNIYRASGHGRYYEKGCEYSAIKVCSRAFYNGSKEYYPFSINIETIQELILLTEEVGEIIFDGKFLVIKIYDDYIE